MEDLIRGLQILQRYNPKASVAAAHEILYAGPGESTEISDVDAKELKELGWFFEEEFNCWARFL